MKDQALDSISITDNKNAAFLKKVVRAGGGTGPPTELRANIVRLFIVRVAPFRRPLSIFSSTTLIVSAKQNVVWLPNRISSEACNK